MFNLRIPLFEIASDFQADALAMIGIRAEHWR